MKHFIRTAFWILSLFGCLSAIPRRLMEADTVESDFDIQMDKIKCEADSTFYYQKDLMPECITAALNCFYEEFKGTVQVECNDEGGQSGPILWLLNKTIEARESAGHVVNNSTECACERGSQVSISDFLKGLQDLLRRESELANSQRDR